MINIAIRIVFALSFFFDFKKRNHKKAYIFICMGMIFLLLALRGNIVDTAGYLNAYNHNRILPFHRLLRLYPLDTAKDPVYQYTAWAFSQVFKNGQWWLAVTSLFTATTIGYLFFKESEAPVISILMYMALDYLIFNLSGIRQSIAMGFIIISYFDIKNKRPFRFIIWVLIASLFHKTALIFLISYPICRFKLGIYHIVLTAVAFAVFFAYKSQLLNLMQTYLTDDRYSSYIANGAEKLSISGFLIMLVIFIFCMIYYGTYTRKDPNAIILYNMCFLGLVFQLFSSFIAEMFRISMYFSMFNMILLPNAVKLDGKKTSSNMMTIWFSIIFILYYFRDGGVAYWFYWQ